MNVQTPFQPPSADALLEGDSDLLLEQLASHRIASFPPAASKEFRKLSPGEAMRLLGVTDSYLRQTAAAIPGLTEPGQSRRSYSLKDLAQLRQMMEARSRSPGKFVPVRRDEEHLQCIAVVNFKGGSAKTTTAANLTQYLALHGYRTLAIDLDPQASLTTLFGVAPETAVGPGQSLYGAIRYDGERVPFSSIVRSTYIPTLDLVPAGLELMEFEHELPRAMMSGRAAENGAGFFEQISASLGPIANEYDVVVIDCPPQLGYLTLSALFAATSVLITVHPQMLDVMSMGQFTRMLSQLLRAVSNALGTKLSYDWVRYLLTRFEPTDGPQAQMAAFLRALFTERVLHNPTLKSTAISDAGLTSQTIYEVERTQFTRSTYDRALDSVNAVNGEIVGLIRSAWGRQ
jgi:chromosome partitioning protein